MCLVVDANIANLIFTNSPRECFAHIYNWVFFGKGRIVLGGKLAKELYHSDKTKKIIQILSQSGRARIIPSEALLETQKRLADSCKSNDSHVLAVAIIGKARLLCSKDSDLCADFKNKEFISNPSGAIYPTKKISKLRHEAIVRFHGCNSKCKLCAKNTVRKRASL